jgi:hypothetical protein
MALCGIELVLRGTLPIAARSPLVAGSPLLNRRARFKTHACGMLRNVNVQSPSGEQRCRKHGKELENGNHPGISIGI